MKVSETTKYIWRFKPIRFNGLPVYSIPQRVNDELDEFDLLFDSEEDFKKLNREATIGLAELDESMNYCEYFVREKGNKGHYVRDGKSFPVDGSWIGIQDFDNYKPCQPFVKWLTENGWRNDWFLLMKRYRT